MIDFNGTKDCIADPRTKPTSFRFGNPFECRRKRVYLIAAYRLYFESLFQFSEWTDHDRGIDDIGEFTFFLFIITVRIGAIYLMCRDDLL